MKSGAQMKWVKIETQEDYKSYKQIRPKESKEKVCDETNEPQRISHGHQNKEQDTVF